jgi:beta-galactosidase/beta-glucuronidase
MLSMMLTVTTLQAQTETQRLYLSGHGCDDMVEWEFYCTKGMHSGEWTHIGVPSCWENQGFGQWQYGQTFYGKAFPEGVADEQGLYRHSFMVLKEWKDRSIELVFEGVMSDAEVKVNGKSAGDTHHMTVGN